MPPYNATQQAMLAQPLPPPASAGVGVNPYSVLAGTQSGTVGMPYKSGSTLTDPGGYSTIAAGDLAASSGITGAASTSGGSNVGGVVGQGEATDYSVDIPEARDMQEEQANEFIDAYTEGYTTETGGSLGHLLEGEGHGTGGKERGANTMSAARSAKRDDRRGDRDNRQKARKELQADLQAEYGETMKKGEARRKARRHSRKAKRTTRRGQKDSRKDAWQDFKGEKDLMKQDQAADLEQYMD